VASAFVLVAQSEDGAVFVSRDGAQPPQLVITLEDMISTPITTSTSDPSVAEDAVLLAAGDIADCDLDGDEATESLLDDLLRSDPAVTVATLDDTFYNSGTAQEFVDCYEPTWGRHKSRTRPVVCNHKYGTAGAAGYFVYFGSAVDDPTKGFYSYELGSWHIVVLNANCNQAGGCGAGSPQET
jgi:acid phosphatase type 7